jgi:hypothetical protein
MNTVNSFDGLQELMYSGQMEMKQFPTTSVVDYTTLTPGQYRMFKHLMVGLDMYTPQELYAMNSSKKAKIFKKNKLTQTILNLWKQEIMLNKTNGLAAFVDNELVSFTKQHKNGPCAAPNSFTKELSIKKNGPLPEIFTTAALKKLLSVEIKPDPKFICTLSFKDLGITKTDIINKLIKENLLPVNFAAA